MRYLVSTFLTLTIVLLTYVPMASAAPNTRCASIDNKTNTVQWWNSRAGHPAGMQSASYRDTGDGLKFSRPVPTIVHDLTGMVQQGRPGHKRITFCR